MNLMLRGSILYACEVFYDLKEYQLRLIERIRQIFKTVKFVAKKNKITI